MFFSFRKRRKPKRTPPDTQRITPTLSVSVWRSRDAVTGKPRLHWQIGRANPDYPSISYRTLQLESIFELPQFLARIAAGFAGAPGVPEHVRQELIEFSKQQQAIVEFRKANGVEEAVKPEGEPPLNF